MKNVVLYFGSFNPIHTAHLRIAAVASKLEGVDEVWFVVSPQNPMKDSSVLADEKHRISMVDLAIAEKELNTTVKSCDVEFSLPRPSYTYQTLEKLREKYPTYSFSIVMGGDNLVNLHRWRCVEQILNSTTIYVYPREGSEVDMSKYSQANIVLIDKVELMNISSTQIRGGKSDEILPTTKKYINDNKLYE